jgi:hypothetical protein
MPLDITVAPLTLEHTVDVACAPPVDADVEVGVEDEPGFDDPPIFMPTVDPELPAPPLVEFAPLGANALGAGCDEASETVVAASTRTAATPTVASPAHHSRAAGPRADQRTVTDCLSRTMAPPHPLEGDSIDPGCQGRASGV